VQVLVDGRPGPWAMVKTGSSYLSQSELPVTLGLGDARGTLELRVTWPDGRAEMLPVREANARLTLKEGSGIVSTEPLVARTGLGSEKR